jgi:hypothetical protein
MRKIYYFLLLSSGCLEVSVVTTEKPPEVEPFCAITPEPAPIDYGYPFDDSLRLDHIQAKGTHNSYHIETKGTTIAEHQYTHVPLDVGLEQLGLRQFELDIHQDDTIGAFTVFHIPVIDPLSTCHLFTDCLSTIKGWSDTHPGHAPIIVWIEPKDDLDFTKITDYDGLDAEIRSVWPPERLFTPDDLQGNHATLKEALQVNGWPTLGQLRDHIIFILLDHDDHMRDYTRGATSLRCRSMFVDQDDPNSDLATFLKINDPADSEVAVAHGLGLIVTSNVDSADQTDAENTAGNQAALVNGVQFMSSDLPASTEGRTYVLDLPGGAPVRCNPVTAPDFCTSLATEDLPR